MRRRTERDDEHRATDEHSSRAAPSLVWIAAIVTVVFLGLALLIATVLGSPPPPAISHRP